MNGQNSLEVCPRNVGMKLAFEISSLGKGTPFNDRGADFVKLAVIFMSRYLQITLCSSEIYDSVCPRIRCTESFGIWTRALMMPWL